MPIQVLMPALSPTMEKGNLAKWLKKEGETIKSGDVIAEIETDKATMEVEATDEGTLGKILIPEGTADVAVNTPIATILSDGENAADLSKAPPPPPKSAAPAPSVTHEVAESRSPVGEGKPMISAPKAPSAPAAVAEPDPEIPAGTEMVTMTIRDALRDAMAEEMRRDPDVFLMGGDVGVEADRRVHDLQFCDAGDRPDHKFRGQDAVHVGRPDGLLDRVPRPE